MTANGRVHILIYLMLTVAALLLPVSSRAETKAEFAQRIKAALQSPTKVAALTALFYLEGVDDDIRAMYEGGHIHRMLSKYQTPHITFEPLTADATFVYAMRGYEYRPNIEPLGYVVLKKGEGGGSTRVPYGMHKNRYYFAGMTKTLVNPDKPAEKTLQIIVIGMAHPPVTFVGWCDVLQSNNRQRRVTIRDNGHGNRTLLLQAQRIERCEVTNTAGRGALSVRLLENDNELFQRRIEAPETLIRYP